MKTELQKAIAHCKRLEKQIEEAYTEGYDDDCWTYQGELKEAQYCYAHDFPEHEHQFYHGLWDQIPSA